ncbi:MAG: glycoside hydrolase family 32 protein [Balneolaceae bacterium]
MKRTISVFQRVKTYKTFVSLIIFPVLFSSCVKKLPDISTSESMKQPFYDEQYRPQFHFTPEMNWMNDPNGLVYHDGEYHLFYQYNPFGIKWGHMSWGHAVSEDMIHWEHLPVALKEENNIMIFSGSAVVDKQNTSGLGSTENPPMVAIYTGNHTNQKLQDQRIAYSLDNGRIWTKYSGNPVIDEEMSAFRDPKVFWHEPTDRWIMVVALPNIHKVRFYSSSNLIDWEVHSDFGPAGATGGVWECPDLFELPVDGDPDNSKWVLQVDIGKGGPFGGSGAQYFIGEFDGKKFTQDSETEGETRWVDYGKDFYAVQSFDNIPKEDGRRIWLAWMSNWQYAGDIPTNPWRSAMTIPREVTLQNINGENRLVQKPVVELQSLRDEHHTFKSEIISGENTLLSDTAISGKTLEIKLRFTAPEAGTFGIKLAKGEGGETRVGYNGDKGVVFIDRKESGKVDFNEHFSGVHQAEMKPINGVIELHILLDRSSVEVFGNGGLISITDRVFPHANGNLLSLYSSGEAVEVQNIDIWKLNSTWK